MAGNITRVDGHEVNVIRILTGKNSAYISVIVFESKPDQKKVVPTFFNVKVEYIYNMNVCNVIMEKTSRSISIFNKLKMKTTKIKQF